MLSAFVRFYDPINDGDMPYYDYSKLTAVNTCPTYGVLRYQLHKTWAREGRAMALEAGSLAHDVFANIRLFHFYRQQAKSGNDIIPVIRSVGSRLFGPDRWEEIVSKLPPLTSAFDDRSAGLNFCLAPLYNAGWVDDPGNKRKTLSHIEESCIVYYDRYHFRHPVYYAPDSGLVGIEIPFDLVLTVHDDKGYVNKKIRFVGKLDGLHTHERDGTVFIEENKSASRLDESWLRSFVTSHQLTGYVVAARAFADASVKSGTVFGLCIPMPKNYDYGGYVSEHFRRENHMINQWLQWMLYSVDQYEKFQDDPINAPKFTHSCNRYFRACQFVDFCSEDEENKQELIEMMETDQWSPLNEG